VRVLEFAVIAIVVATTLAVLWGVFTRFVMQDPSHWTKEASEVLLIWMALLGTAVASERREHLGVDYFAGLMHDDARRLNAVMAELVVLAFAAAAMVYGGCLLVGETLASGQVLPAMGVLKGYVYLAVPISGAFLVLFSVERIVELWRGDPSAREQPPAVDNPEAQAS